MFALQDANEDDEVFPDPARFDVARQENPHLSFSHGLHFCLGASVARMELQILFGRLFRRFPTLRLTVPVDEIRTRLGRAPGRAPEVPVDW